MNSNQITLAFANDSEISALGFASSSEAVSFYSEAATRGFEQCRFVSFGLQDIIEGVDDDDYVIVVTGVTQLHAYIDTFGSRPTNIRGWILFSNCNYFLETLDLIFGRRGGGVIPVDQYMCGSDGKPVLQKADWELMDYFGDDDEEIVLCGITYVKAWITQRAEVSYENQNVASITSIQYCSTYAHTLADGTIMRMAGKPKLKKSVVLSEPYNKIYKDVGSPFVDNGKDIREIVKRPVFLHALVRCRCGVTQWSVGDWKGYKSPCCGVFCKPISLAAASATPGAVVFTSPGAGTGVKYYNNMFLRHICDIDGLGVWRLIKVQSKDDLVVSGKDVEHECLMDPCYFINDSKLATAYKIAILSGDFSQDVKQAIIAGQLSVGSELLDVTQEVLGTPWFVRKLGDLFSGCWNNFVEFVRSLKLHTSHLVDLAKRLACASLSIVKGTFKFTADVPAILQCCVDKLVSLFETVFDATCDFVKLGSKCFSKVGDYLLLDNALAQLVKVKVRGPRQAGINSVQYASVVLGPTQKVKSSRVEFHKTNLVLVDEPVPVTTNGYTVVVEGLAFHCADGFYRLMANEDTVLEEPVFRSAEDLKPIFECKPIEGFPIVTASNVAELCVKTDNLLKNYCTVYRKYTAIIKGEKCCVTCDYEFHAPSYIENAERFVSQCESSVDTSGFSEFYTAAHEAGDLATFIANCCSMTGFECFMPELPACPKILEDIDGGSIWQSVIAGVKSVVDFVRNLRIDFGLEGIVVNVSKRFKKAGALLAQLYNTFLDSVCSIVRLAGVSFKYYATAIPKIVVGACYYGVKDVKVDDLDIPSESEISEFRAFNCCTFPVKPKRVELESIELEEVDFVAPKDFGKLSIINGYSFYCDGKRYYPSDIDGVAPVCYQKKGGGVVTISDEVQVKSIDPVHKVKIEFEFEDDALMQICSKITGTSIKITGGWDKLLETIDGAMDLVREHVDVPDYFVYDEEGGNDITLPVMVSQWPLSDQDDVVPSIPDEEYSDEDGDVDTEDVETKSAEQLEVEEALSFINDATSEEPVAPPKDVFAFDYVSYGGLKVLNLQQNNCWVASALIQLQLLDVLDDTAMDLLKVGRVSPMVKKCYEAESAIVGSLGDVSACLEKLLKHKETLSVKCSVTCDCGIGERVYKAATLRMTPTTEPFPYGACPNCAQVLVHTLVSISGTGIFCREPTPVDVDTFVIKPICASAYIGARDGGHYMTNIYSCEMCVDGNGRYPINHSTLNTICVKDVKWEKPIEVVDVATPPAPFLTFKNVEFYQGDFKDIVTVPHDFIVNAANEKLSHGGGIALAINTYTKGLLQRLSDAHIRAHGQLKVSTGVMLHCGNNKVFNIVGPRKGKHAPELLTKAYTNVFAQPGVPLLPLLSVGIFRVPIKDSLSALLACVGQRVCRCFCYSDEEREAIIDYVSSITQVEVQPETSTETVPPPILPTQDKVVDCKPFRVEGATKFYDYKPDLVSLKADKIVSFTKSNLQFCNTLSAFDSHFNGGISAVVQEYLKQNPSVPSGNCITFKCDKSISFTMVVLPDTNSEGFDKNYRRALNKYFKLKGTLLVAVSNADVFKDILHHPVLGYITTPDVVDAVYPKEPIVLNVTSDNRNSYATVVDPDKTLGEQLGPCSIEGENSTESKPLPVNKEVFVLPEVDWEAHYGFKYAGIFHALDHSAFAFDNDIVSGKRVLKTTDNNCWVNVTCLQLQFANAKFKSKGLQALWESYCVGDVATFIHWLYWITNVNKGEPSDSENALNVLSKYLCVQGSIELTTAPRLGDTCDESCSSSRTVATPVVNASLLRHGFEDGVCKHGEACVTRVSSVKGTVIIVNPGKPLLATPELYLDGLSYTIFTDNGIGAGHYTVLERCSGLAFDGDTRRPADLATSQVTSMVASVNNNVVFKDTAKKVEFDVSKFMDKMNYASEKFFTFGDFVSRNLLTLLVYLFSILSLCYRSFKKRDLKVLAGVPQRTGIILRKSVKYNTKALGFFFKIRFYWVKQFLKLCLCLYTVYALSFMLIRFTPVGGPLCNGYADGYANSTFDKNEYCSGVLCKICLYGYQELSDFSHTKVVWQHLKDPLIGNVMPFFYLAFLTIFGDLYARTVAFYFFLQYFNAFGVALGYQDSVWFLQAIPFDVFGDEIVVSFVVIRVLLFLKHVLFGCDKPSCVACSKSAKLTRVPLQTIIQGTNKSFYVHANGGKKFCKKHNFFCVNCDSYGPGCTFINDVIAPEVGNVVKLNVVATSPATIEIDKVEFSNGFYYLYSGSTFWKYNFDITEGKYSCKEALKSCNVVTDFIVYNNSGSNLTQVKNACVYFSQMLCKPIKLVDSALLASLNVDFSANLHSAFVGVLNNSFGKDLSNCATMSECRTTLGFDEVSDEDFNAAVSEAHRYDVLLTDISFNNFFTSYAKPEEKLPVHDIVTCMRIGAKVANHNVLTKDNLSVVWLVRDFMALSDESRKYLVRTTKVKGLNFMLTFNDRRMHTTIPTVNIANKKGAGVPSFFSNCYKFCWYFCMLVVLVFFSISFYDFSTQVTSISDYDFRYIENGVLKDFHKPLSCVHNVFDNFDSWHQAKFGVVPINARHCPIVVGTSDEARTIPGIPSGVFLYGKTLVFAMNTIFGSSGLCFDERGIASKGSCIFNAACTTLTGIGGSAVYCYKNGLVEGSKLYSDLLPHSHYKMVDGNTIVLPEIISRGFGFRTIKTRELTYCRVGQCIDSQEGVCLGSDSFFVYNTGTGSEYVCGKGLFSLIFNLFSVFSKSVPVMVLSGQILFNCIIAFLAVSACFVFTKFKRMFGDMSYGVFVVGCCTIINNLSYVLTQNSLGMLAYAIIYFLSTRGVKYSWIWHTGFCVSYCLLAPWWLVVWYLLSALLEFMPNLMKLKVSTQLFDGDKFVGSFESAASGTFVLDMHSYERLANSISSEKLKQYASTYNKYKYYTGAGNEADYRLACYAHLAKAMMDFGTSHQDTLYTPPTVSYNSTLQAGLRKMAQPSGIVERCMVRVSYGNMTLNGLWLGDVVICPRHVIASNTNNVIDYEKELSLVRLHNFSVSYGNMFLGVVGVTMRGALLHIKVNQANVNTPSYTYRTLRPGESFNILACYDGGASGVYGVNMRTNYTIRGSFISGACGSPGYNLSGGVVEFCYMHQLELGSGCHVGCDLDGAMYGGYEDQPTLQIEGASSLITENVLAFLYGALINGCRWWLSASRLSVEKFNEWAVHNGMTIVGNVDTYSILAAKTGVDVPRMLASIQSLQRNFGGKQIMGYTSLTDEFTTAEVIKQMFGVNLQSSKISRAFRNVFIIGAFLTLFWTELVAYTKFFWLNPGYVTPMFLCIAAVSSLLMLFLKHKLLFLQMFLLPSVVITAAINLSVDFKVYAYLEDYLDYHVSMMGVNAQGILNIVLCVVVMLIHTFRFTHTSSHWLTYLSALLSAVYNYVYVNDPLSCAITLFSSLTGHWFIGALVYKAATLVVAQFPIIAVTFDEAKGIVLCYMALGYLVCMFYGALYWINRFCKLRLGVYDFMVSPAEFKYMVANGLRAPRGAFDSLTLSLRLIGVGGDRCIKVSSVQSKLTDIKCTNVVLLGCLTSMNVNSNSAEWAYCVDLHNKINLCNDPVEAQEMLLALLAFFLSKNSAFGLDDLLESYFSDNTMLQSVASTYVNMPAYLAYENARQNYEDAVANQSSPQLIRQLRTAMNVAKADFDREASTQRKLDRMAEQAAAQMYKEARAVNRKSKVTSAMHSLLFGMLRRLDMSSVDVLLQLAKDGTVPLSVIPALSATKLNIVVSDLESYNRLQREGCVHYAGVIWSVLDVKDNDGKVVHVKEITAQNAESLAWPLFLSCERIVKLQNNEIIPGKLKQRAMKAEGDGFVADGKALYNTEGGRTFMYAFISDKADLKVVKWEFDGGSNTIELEPPRKFLVESPAGPVVKYLYFVCNLNNLRRGAVLGFIGATVRLQAGKQTEHASNSSILTLCSFAVDPAKTYIDAVKSGQKPVGNCIKMLSNGSGNGMAITNGVEATGNQDSYGGASVCLYCRAHVEHPAMDGICRLKGKYVQMPIGTTDPIRYVLENTVCKVCGCWQANGCACDRSTLQTSFDPGLFKRVRGSSAARLEPCNGTDTQHVYRAFDIYNRDVACISKFMKVNCVRFKNLDLHDAFWVIKKCTKSVMDHEQSIYELISDCGAVAKHDFFQWKEGRSIYGNVCRQDLTEYTMMDLCYALRNFDESNCDTLKKILVVVGACDETYFENKSWFDPVENEDIHRVYSILGKVVARAMLKCVAFCDAMVEKGIVGIVTLDNQDLNGNFYDFGDFATTVKGMGVPVCTSYYSYMMPVMGLTNCLASECFIKSDIFGEDFRTYDLLEYDFTEHKTKLFEKYFKHWGQAYHPNCVDCYDEQCVVHCANFNTLFATTIPMTAFGPLCRKCWVDGVPLVTTAGYHFKQLGIVWNKDFNVHSNRLTINELLQFCADPALLVASSPALVDRRTVCFSVAALSTGMTSQTVKPGHFNKEFYDFLRGHGFFEEGADLTLKHFFFAQKGDAAIKDFDFYRYNRTTVLDICQARVVYQIVQRYFDIYEGGCITAKEVVVTNLNKSAGFPFNKFGKAGLYYESLSYEEQDELYAYTKRNILPTMTQLNLKYAISGKERARTVGGVSLLSTMTTRQYHQKHLKSIVNTRGASVVIGTTKFYGGWDNMLRTLIGDVENPNLMGWDYPKCDRALPNMIRMISAMILGSKHVTCCNSTDRFYRLCNELAQVLTEVIYSNGGFYLKPGGTTSGDATTAYANSVFNIFQAVSANVNRLLSVDSNTCNNLEVKLLQRKLYDCCYRSSNVDASFVDEYFGYLRKHFSMMILSDDGVVCYNSEYASLGYVADLKAFKAVLYYQNNVFMSESKCWVEPDINKGPHEFCSQHTMQIVDKDGTYFLPYPDPSRILSAGVFVDDIVKTDPVILLERYVSLAIDAYPLSKHDNPEYRKVFTVLLDWVKHLYKTLNQGVLESFSVTLLEDATAKFWDESFYANMYERSAVLQSAGLCVVCASQTVLRCGDCLRRPMLCTKCAYDHVIGTNHKFILAITPYVCCASGCGVSDVTKLYLGGLSYWCVDHKPRLAFPLCSAGNVFGLYKNSATGSPDVEDFNILATSEWTDVRDYKLANDVKDSLRLFAAETVKAKEESVKSSYACATIHEVIGPKELVLKWEGGKPKPPLNRNSIFTCYHITKNTKFQIGEFTFEKLEYDNDAVSYKSTATTKLLPGMIFVLTSHNVQPLKAPTLVNQERYSSIYKLHPALNIHESYSSLVPYYQMIGKQKITTIQGPPGSGKSHCVIGLGLYYPGARIVFTACSHAAVDSLCVKAATAYSSDKCSRIIPQRARVECYDGFKSNNTSAQYLFSTVNALPEVNCDICVVDEVSMCTNYDLSVINQRVSFRHIVYVGDPQQLPAPRVMITRGVLEPRDYNVITQRMCAIKPDIFLHKCYRCPAEIVRTVSEMVYENQFQPVHPDSKQCFKIFCKGNVQVDNGSSINRRQLEVVRMFIAKNPAWAKAVFISPYNSQNYVASRVLGLQIQTVDSSQGSEYDYVIYTQTSDTAHACNRNRFNVAITRAKKGILCVMCDRELFDLLKFYELKLSDLQAGEGCGLFKDCYKGDDLLPPSHANTFMALSDSFKTDKELAVQIGVSGQIKYEHVMSFMGFRFDINVPNYHTLFCTRDFAMRHVRGWLGFDVEGAHVTGSNVGTNVPLQLGFSNGVDFVVRPEGCVSTETGDYIKPVRARAPPGEQFTHLLPLIRKGQPWDVVRRRIVQMCSDYLSNLSDILIFVLWAGGLELTTMRYFLKIGPVKHCDCGKIATCYNSSSHSFCCFRHALGCDYLYNAYCIDIQQWGYTGSLSLNHHEHCNVHRNEHVASGDAIMTRCLAIHNCFVKNVDWSITYPFIANEQAINKSGRIIQSHIMRAAIKLYSPKAIHDVGNPKGTRCVATEISWYCYDKNPTKSNVKVLEYDYITHGQLEGLCLFWNCNVDMYPEFSVVCRFDTRCRSNLNLEGCNGGSLYVNNHAFHTPAFDKRAVAKLKAMPFFFYDDSECDKLHDSINYVPLRASNCITKCNVGGAVCSKHCALYHNYVNAYNTFTAAGFTIWVPTTFDVYNLWQTFSVPNLQGLENIAFNVVKKGSFVGAEGELPVAIVSDRVMVRDGAADNVVYTNKTSLPTNVAFELYAKRKIGLTPPLTILKNLGVVCTYKCVLWDYEAERPLTTFTKSVCSYTDFDGEVCTLFDNSVAGAFERFTMAKNGVLISLTAIKKLTAIKINYGYLNGVPVSTHEDKPFTWYIYTRKNGAFDDYPDGYFTQGRTASTFKARSTMEEDFLSMDTSLFVSKYGLEDYGFEHVVYGDVSKSTLGGLHLLISQIRLANIGILRVEDFVSSSDSTLKSCTVTYADDPSSKMVCTYVDLLLDDFVSILKSLDLSVVSKVHEVIVDCKVWRWMLWCKDNKVQTFYPQLQSAEWKCGYSMPSLYKIQRMCLEPCNLYNYGTGIKLPEGIMFNVVKYTQLCQYLNSTTMCIPHHMRVLHLGAGSDKGVAPGTAVLRRWLPLDAVIVDNDVNDYVSDADFSVTGDCSSLYLTDKFDLVISDMYDGKIKSCDGENVSKEGFFPYINGVITEKLALGGTVAIKITEFSWNKKLYELIQKFEYWTMFCTSVNTSSSEAFLIGVHYLGDFATNAIIDGNIMHANYIFWRNSTMMSMSYYSVLDLSKFNCKHKATVVLNLKESSISDVVIGLLKNGKLLIRNSGAICGFSNHLVNTTK
ncbi:polyprotein [Bat alphacoronavirus]|uniref:ORF1ab polyprotein n=14 Tax=Orthocoronavirinae TaxID=2501931 RepID=A0AAD0TNX8_9ALPC|nr:polyprotein [Bat alphacoronavirus]AYH64861.2 polyprotein [Bat alphacoronavirus]